MEVEALREIVKRWEDDQKVAVIVMEQDSEMAKVIRESRWNVKHECDVNHAQKALDRYCQGLPSQERHLLYPLGTGLIMSYINLSRVARRLKCGRMHSTTIAATTPTVTIQHIRAINGRTGICLKLKRVCDVI
jgi:hypothetical protein